MIHLKTNFFFFYHKKLKPYKEMKDDGQGEITMWLRSGESGRLDVILLVVGVILETQKIGLEVVVVIVLDGFGPQRLGTVVAGGAFFEGGEVILVDPAAAARRNEVGDDGTTTHRFSQIVGEIMRARKLRNGNRFRNWKRKKSEFAGFFFRKMSSKQKVRDFILK